MTNKDGIQYGGVNVKLGGFIENAGIYRTRNEVSDVGSDYNQGIPFNNNPLAHENETRFSARQSRLSLLVTGDVNPETHLAAYYEMDFLASGTTSNSRESNSYTPRSRQLYATLDKDDWGLHVLAGQTWSLMTTNTVGIIPRKEQIPLTIDAQYVEGFNWLRVPQFRIVEDFGYGVWAGVSAESPQMVTSPITAPSSGNYTNTGDGAGLLNSTTTYSNDYIPDFDGKIAVDPGWGHYELKTLLRTFTAREGGANRNATGYGVGGAAAMPIVPTLRRSATQRSVRCRHRPLRLGPASRCRVQVGSHSPGGGSRWRRGCVGIIGHPWAGNDLYLYGGWEHADRAGTSALLYTKDAMGNPTVLCRRPGYGSGLLNVSGCNNLSGTCQAQTRDLQQITAGFWQDIYKGSYGRFVGGFEGGQIWRTGFSGTGGQHAANQHRDLHDLVALLPVLIAAPRRCPTILSTAGER